MNQKDFMNLKSGIESVYETDMGDFKRRVVTYLNLFLEGETEASIRSQVKEIKKFVICYVTPELDPVEEIDTLRLALLKKLESL